MSLPTGVVTFVFTDVEGSTRLLQRMGDDYAQLLDRMCELVTAAMEDAGGTQFGTEGDALFFAFLAPRGALGGALAAQRALAVEDWPQSETVLVRIGIDSGEASLTSTGNYVGLALHRAARICAAGHGGQVVVSDATRQLAPDLPEGAGWTDLGHHRLRDLPEPLRLFELRHADLAGPFPRLRSDAAPGNLPKQRTSFVGRAREIEAATTWLREGAAVVTLAGPGGAGKTRLALEVAAEVVDDYPQGAWLVDLAAVSEAELVAQAVATTLDVRDEPGRALEETLVSSLRSKRLLLVLDNCEHVVEQCAAVASRLAASCAGVQILATSQEALGLPEERVLGVPSLVEAEGTQLFLDRAAVHRPGLVLDESNAAAIAQISRRLDGIPLAIELAAARVAVLTPKQIADRLDDSFRLLSGGSRSLLPRQRTLRATVDWSYQLLQPIEQVLLRRLGVFAGGWSLEGAEAVCAGGDLESASVLDVLGRLVARSLVVVEERDGEARYRLLETIRQYATEKLAETGEVEALRERHMGWFRRLAIDTQPGLTGPAQARLLAVLDAEYGNLSAAMEWAASQPDGRVLLEMAAALWRFWLVRGHWSEGRMWLDQALRHGAGSVDDRTRARALAAAGDLATEQGDHAAAEELLNGALTIWRRLDDRPGVAKALNHLGNLSRARFEYDSARALLTASLDMRRLDGNDRGSAVTLRNLGLVAALQRDFETARSLYEDALPLARGAGDKRVVASLTQALSHVAFTDGDHDRATRLAEEGLSIATELGDRRLLAEHLTVLAALSAAEGDQAGADARRDEALALLAALDGGDAVAWAHTTLGELAASAGDVDAARLHLEAAAGAWRRIGDEAALARVLTRAGHCACLVGDAAVATTLLDEAVELARRADEPSELAAALHAMGEVARYRGDLAYANRLYEQSLEVARATGWRRLLWGPVHGLAAVARRQGRHAEALDLLRQSIALRPGVGRRLGTATCLDEVAAVAADTGQPGLAARLLGAAAALRAGIAIPPVRGAEYEELRARLRGALGEEDLELAFKAGAALSPDEAVALASEVSA